MFLELDAYQAVKHKISAPFFLNLALDLTRLYRYEIINCTFCFSDRNHSTEMYCKYNQNVFLFTSAHIVPCLSICSFTVVDQ